MRPDSDSYRPLVVVHGDVAQPAVIDELLGAGWSVGTHAAAVLVCDFADRDGAEPILIAALGGAGLVVRATVVEQALDDLVEDLERLGPVLVVDDATAVVLDVDTWRLLHAMAAGATLTDAALALHLSLRTANRRLTDAKSALGAQSRGQLLRGLGGPARIRPPATISRP